MSAPPQFLLPVLSPVPPNKPSPGFGPQFHTVLIHFLPGHLFQGLFITWLNDPSRAPFRELLWGEKVQTPEEAYKDLHVAFSRHPSALLFLCSVHIPCPQFSLSSETRHALSASKVLSSPGHWQPGLHFLKASLSLPLLVRKREGGEGSWRIAQSHYCEVVTASIHRAPRTSQYSWVSSSHNSWLQVQL